MNRPFRRLSKPTQTKYTLSSQQLSSKQRTKHSFQKLMEENALFDTYIESIYEQMQKERADNPTLIVPRNFKAFISSKLFKQFLSQLYEYLSLYVNCHALRKEVGEAAQMQYEQELLTEKCKEMSFAYMGILLSHGECKFIFRDQYFFETMIYFISQVLKSNFEDQEYVLADEELNRIFRTDTFNLIKRRREEDRIVSRFPHLKEARYESTEAGAEQLARKIAIQKKIRKSFHSKQPFQKPLDVPLSTHRSLLCRSPLVGLKYPSISLLLLPFKKKVL